MLCRISKIITVFLIVFMFVGVAYGIEFNWNQEISEDFAGWKLYQGSTSGGPYTQVLTIEYSGTPSDVYRAELQIPEVVGQSVDYYFVLTAFDTAYNESDYSNQVKYTASDITSPAVPQVLIIKITQVSN